MFVYNFACIQAYSPESTLPHSVLGRQYILCLGYMGNYVLTEHAVYLRCLLRSPTPFCVLLSFSVTGNNLKAIVMHVCTTLTTLIVMHHLVAISGVRYLPPFEVDKLAMLYLKHNVDLYARHVLHKKGESERKTEGGVGVPEGGSK